MPKRKKRKGYEMKAYALVSACVLVVFVYAIHTVYQFKQEQTQTSQKSVPNTEQDQAALTVETEDGDLNKAEDSTDNQPVQNPENKTEDLVKELPNVNETVVYQGKSTTDLNIRIESGTDSDIVFVAAKGTVLNIVEDLGNSWVRIKALDGRTGWCNKEYLDISSEPVTELANSLQEYPSFPTVSQISWEEASWPISIYVSLEEQTVSVVDAQNLVVHSFPCSTGTEGYETPMGTYSVAGRGYSFFNEGLQEGAYYWTQFYGDYLFHSIPFDVNRELQEGEIDKLGQPASHGCIRLSMDNAKWIYENIESDTQVIIY
ncbi:L,D-transpeptidase family protein [Scatolibacter rhodanostii]|uniref:L,D-transpeptidase family protein n=1 Tax=Scatolibacter rhodanostii TaxID=2014781 RepID=UPI000C07572D|nr:L,D-transpeptidase family protein [Scatolibacter rhodanostii]